MSEQTYIYNNHVCEVHLSEPSDHLESVLTLALNGTPKWSLTVPMWRGVSFGATKDFAYLWTAWHLIVLPQTMQETLSVIDNLEELMAPFYRDDGWVMVGEISISRWVGGVQTFKAIPNDVIMSYAWDMDELITHDFNGDVLVARVAGDSLDLTFRRGGL